MRLSAITDEALAEAINAQEKDEFGTHQVIFWMSRNRPRPYAQDLYLALQDDGDPFVSLHAAIARRLAQLPDLVEQQHRKRVSLNVRGLKDSCEVWRKARQQEGEADLSPRLVPLRKMLIDVARRGDVTHYGPVAEVLGIEGKRLDHCPELSRALDEISTFECENGRPLLSVVVVRQPNNETGMRPGGGFFKMARRNRVQKPDEDDDTFFSAELRRCYDYWKSHGK